MAVLAVEYQWILTSLKRDTLEPVEEVVISLDHWRSRTDYVKMMGMTTKLSLRRVRSRDSVVEETSDAQIDKDNQLDLTFASGQQVPHHLRQALYLEVLSSRDYLKMKLSD